MIGERTTIRAEESCLDCGRALSHLQRVTGARFCGEACRRRHAPLAPHEVCAGCGRRLSPHQFGERLCDDPACRRRIEERAREVERLRIESLREDARALRDREAGSAGVAEPDLYPPVVIPALRRRFVPLDENRASAFRDRLTRLIAEASARLTIPTCAPAPKQAVRPSPAASTVAGHACALCRGWCCRNGGNHAYLTADVLRGVMAEHPAHSSQEVLATYLNHLGGDTVEGSCIFHRVDGCGLPHELRSETCNAYFCPSLTEYQAAPSGQDPVRGFFAATAGAEIIAAAFCDQDGSAQVTGTGDLPSERRLTD